MPTSASVSHAFACAPFDMSLTAAPLRPETILAGAPMARSAVLSLSHDKSTSAIAWDCTAGRFRWDYQDDETVCIVSGTVVINADGQPEKRLQPGDVAYFPAGTSAVWHIDAYVRKVAICRKPLTGFVLLVARVNGRLEKLWQRLQSRDPVPQNFA